MDEGQQGSQYAIQIAVHTLRDRCKYLQQHVALLEEENVNLKIKCSRQEESRSSLNELDHLRAQVAQLAEQKEQLQGKIKMVTSENQDLWSKLSKLTRVNKSLGSQLTKINDTLTQHTTTPQHNLIRSKTFTKSELQTKVLQKNLEENDKLSLELEDVSLKFSDSFSRQKKELDLLCSEISEMTFANEDLSTSSCGFLYEEDLENDVFNDVQLCADNLRKLREVVNQQQTLLELNVKNMHVLKEKMQSKTCQCKKNKIEKSTTTIDLINKLYQDKGTETEPDWSKPPESGPIRNAHVLNDSDSEKICPMCTRIFQKGINFDVFLKHVEDHFVPEMNGYEML